MAINNGAIAGNLTRDAEYKVSQSGTGVLSFSVAVNEWSKDGDRVSYFDCTMFGKRADALQHFLTKGRKVTVSYRLHQDRWQTKEGDNRSKVVLYVDELEFMNRGDEQQPRPAEADAELADADLPF